MNKQHISSSFLIAAMITLLAACGGGGGGSSAPSYNMDASGGTVTSTDNRAAVIVPAGAVSNPVTLSIEPVNGMQGNVGTAYDFNPDGLSFAVPVTITIQYDDADVGQNMDENDLVLAMWTGSTWSQIIGSGSDPVNNIVSGETTHFSTYGIVPFQLLTNTPPVVADFSFSVQEGATYSGMLSGSDADSDPLTYRFVNTGTQGTATITNAATGAFTYTANTGAAGTDSLTYVANDGSSDSNTGAVTVFFPTLPASHLLQVTKADWGSGQVVLTSPAPTDPPLNCGDGCYTYLTDGTQAVLTAYPTAGSTTVQWSGCDVASGTTCTVNMTADRYVTATFNAIVDAAVPQNDNNGTYALRWTCSGAACTTSYLIQEAGDETFAVNTEYSYSSPDPITGAKGFSTKADGVYCYRVTSQLLAPLVNWSKPVCVVVNRLERDSVGFRGEQAAGDSFDIHIAPYGHSVVFSSTAANLVSGDTEGFRDVFFRDTDGGSFYRASAVNGVGGDGDSTNPVMTPDGRYIAFFSDAGNLVATDSNGSGDYFVYDHTTRLIERVSVNNSGQSPQTGNFIPGLDMSWNGRYVVFSTSSDLDGGTDDTNFEQDVYLRDRAYGYTFNLSKGLNDTVATGDALNPVISGSTGRYIAYESDADNLVANDTNNVSDIFLYDMRAATTTTTLVSTNESGAQANGPSYNPSITADGRYVAFDSFATNLVPGDTNNQRDVFVKDTVTGKIWRVSETETMVGGSPVIVQGNGSSYYPRISAQGYRITFQSQATNLRTSDTNNNDDVYIKYMPTATLTGPLAFVNRVNGTAIDANNFSGGPAISADGMYVGFMSMADNLIRYSSIIDAAAYNDTNGGSDVFTYSLKNSSFAPPAENADNDGDGLTNIYELTVSFTLPFNADTDGDGVNDKDEVDAGTDPLDPISN